MAGKHVGKSVLIGGVALGVAFWGGRMSVNRGEDVGVRDGGNVSGNGVRPANRTRASGGGGVGIGEDAVVTAEGLRKLFRKYRGDGHQGQLKVADTLKRMSSEELRTLADDLVRVPTAGYRYHTEITALCSAWAEVDAEAALAYTLANTTTAFRTTAVSIVLNVMVRANPEATLARINAIDDPGMQRKARFNIFHTLGHQAPDLWLAEMAKFPEHWIGNSTYSIVSNWANDQPELAAKRLAQFPEKYRQKGMEVLGQQWGASDPEAALAWARSLSNRAHRDLALAGVVTGIAHTDPAAAAKLFTTLEGSGRKIAMGSAFGTLANTDFDAALGLADHMPTAKDKHAALHRLLLGYDTTSFAGGWSSDSTTFYGTGSTQATPVQLRKMISTLPTGDLRRHALGQLGAAMAHYPQEHLNAMLGSYPEKDHGLILNRTVWTLSHSDPKRALVMLDSIPATQRDPTLHYRIVSSLAQHDPEESLKISMQAKTPKKQAQLANYAFTQLAKSDPAAAANRFTQLSEGPVRDAAMQSVASQWGRADPASAIDWAEKLSPKEKDQALSRIIPALASSDPEAAVKVIEQTLAKKGAKVPSYITNSTKTVVIRMGMKDPVTAGQWVENLPEGRAKSEAIKTLAGGWGRDDINGASDWINSLDHGKDRDTGIKAVVSNIRQRDPATAFGWANAVGDDRQRMNELQEVVSMWASQDPEQARAMIEKAEFSDVEREQLMKALE